MIGSISDHRAVTNSCKFSKGMGEFAPCPRQLLPVIITLPFELMEAMYPLSRPDIETLRSSQELRQFAVLRISIPLRVVVAGTNVTVFMMLLFRG
jgi:hypothetical protein